MNRRPLARPPAYGRAIMLLLAELGCAGGDALPEPDPALSIVREHETFYERGGCRVDALAKDRGFQSLGQTVTVTCRGVVLAVPGATALRNAWLDPARTPSAVVLDVPGDEPGVGGIWLVATDARYPPVPVDAEKRLWWWVAGGAVVATRTSFFDIATGTRTALPSGPTGWPLDLAPDRKAVLFEDPYASLETTTLTLTPLDGGAARTWSVSKAEHPWLKDHVHCIPNSEACNLWRADHLAWTKKDDGWDVLLQAEPKAYDGTREPLLVPTPLR